MAVACHPPYRDADRSASRYAKRLREDFKRLISDLELNEFDADILAIWESSRGSRRVGEWVDLVDLCMARGVRIWVTTHNRLYDPTNARDRRSLLEDAVDAEYESDKTSERRKRSAKAAAEAGRPHGKNIYGYTRVYDEFTRELLRVEPAPAEAAIVQEVARRILAGDTFYSVARDLNARDIPTRRAKRLPPLENAAWTPSTVKQMLRLPAYAGKRDYRGVIVGDGMWPALVPYAEWQQLQIMMDTAGRKGPRDHTAKYLLSSIAVCGVCGSSLKSAQSTYRPRGLTREGEPREPVYGTYYHCPGVPGRVRGDGTDGWHAGIKASALDEIVIGLTLARIEHPDFLAAHGKPDPVAQERRAELMTAIVENEKYLEDVRAQAAEARRFELILDQEKRIRPLIDSARETLRKTAAIDPFVERLLDSADMKATWESFALEDQRRVIRFVVTPVVHRVTRAWRGRRELNVERVKPIWR